MALRTDLDGRCIKHPERIRVFFVDRGQKRHVLDVDTFFRIFRDWRVDDEAEIDAIEDGPDVSLGAAIIGVGEPPGAIYLVDNGTKRHVLSPAVMDRYNFRAPFAVVPEIALRFVPDGPAIGLP